jgi:hypothetical protein
VNKQQIIDFDPTIFSHEENKWLLENIDKPVPVALATIRAVRMPAEGRNKNNVIYPDGVNPNAVRPFLERLRELDELKEPWQGREAIKTAIITWLAVDAKWESDHRRTRGRAPRFPSFYSFDSRGKGHFGGPGSDNGKVKTYFDGTGARKELAIPLIAEEVVEWSPGFTEKPAVSDIVVNADAHRIECFCGHTERFKEGSRPSYNAARARISKHLRTTTEDVERHREAYTLEFKG